MRTGRERANVTIFEKGEKKDVGNYSPGSLTSITGRMMEQIILENISKHTKGKKVSGNSQQGFGKGKSCLT